MDSGDLSKYKKQRNTKLRETGKQVIHDLGLSEDQVDNIFDLISEEFPEL